MNIESLKAQAGSGAGGIGIISHGGEGGPMSLDLGRYSDLAGRGSFGPKSTPAFAGISGGRTSAMMAALLHPSITLCFQNTGREHPECYRFLERLEGALERPIVWIEFRKPAIVGTRPRDFEFAVVTPATANRSGKPFEDFLEAVGEYRATKGLGALAPWARSRICTAYMKHKLQDHWVKSLGVGEHDNIVGLRADEPKRVSDLRARETSTLGFRFPLHSAGITKPDVLAFWREQSFDLEHEEHQGNCTACFLKDEADLARVLGEPETDAAWWLRVEATYKDFGGRRFQRTAGYRRLLSERSERLRIEETLRGGGRPDWDGSDKSMDPRRFVLVVRQEKLRIKNGPTAASCGCAATMGVDSDDDRQIDLFFGEEGAA